MILPIVDFFVIRKSTPTFLPGSSQIPGVEPQIVVYTRIYSGHRKHSSLTQCSLYLLDCCTCSCHTTENGDPILIRCSDVSRTSLHQYTQAHKSEQNRTTEKVSNREASGHFNPGTVVPETPTTNWATHQRPENPSPSERFRPFFRGTRFTNTQSTNTDTMFSRLHTSARDVDDDTWMTVSSRFSPSP